MLLFISLIYPQIEALDQWWS